MPKHNPDSLYASNFATYSDLGATAVDTHDGAVSVSSSGTVDLLHPGSYVITYTASDAAGNASSAARTVVVKSSGGGGVLSGPQSVLLPTIAPRPQVIYPDGRVVYLDLAGSTSTAPISTAFSSPAGTTTTGIVLLKNRQLKDSGEDIRSLQKFLNGDGFQITATGPGSPGKETSIFGILTYRALQKFQKSKGIPSTGYLGPLSRAAILNNARQSN